MKKIYLWLLFTVTSSVLIFSCRKDYKGFFDQEKDISFDLEAAKIFHAKGAYLNKITYAAMMAQDTKGVLSTEKTSNKSVFFKLAPLWKDAFEVKANDGSTLIVVPTPENRLSDKTFEIRRFFIFTKKSGSIVEGKIIEFLGVQYALKDKMNDLIANYKNNKVLDLTGGIFEYDLNYFFLNGERIEHGKRTGLFSKFNNLSKAITQSDLKTSSGFETGPMDPNKCYWLYWCTYDDNNNVTSATFIGYSDGCYRPSTGSDSGYDSSSSYMGGGAPYAGNPPPTIVNNVQDPCISGTVNKVLDANGVNKLQTTIYNLFQSTKKLNLNISQNSSILDYGTTQSVTTGGVTNINVTLNHQMLSSSSKEMVASVIIHEVIHAYMSANGISPSSQHEAMANSYINEISGLLKSLYPDLPEPDSRALSWGGLSGTGAWADLSTSTPDDIYEMGDKQTKYTLGQLGTKCN